MTNAIKTYNGLSASSGGGGSTLIESFDHYTSNLPTDLGWAISAVGATYGSSGSHVTQGTASFNIIAPSTQYLFVFGVDLSAYTSLSTDIYVATAGSSGYAQLQVRVGKSTQIDTTSVNFTGADTLTVDLTAFVTRTSCDIYLQSFCSGGTPEYYWDNMRAP